MLSRRRTSSSIAGVGVAAALLLSGCTSAEDPAAESPSPSAPASPSPTPSPTPTPTPVPAPETPRTVASGLDAPWSMAVVGDTVFVSERDTARILEVAPDGATRVVGTIAGVAHSAEGGLLGLATDGDSLFVYSTARSGNRVERYPLTGEPGSYGLGGRTSVIDGMPAGTHHNGGRIAFGPDGMLYIANGDTSDEPASQDPGSLAGKILRIAPDGGIPSDNPDPTSPVYSLGHRNVQGFAWAEDGTMFASEFGRNYRDELNIIEPGGNYGWPYVESTGGEGDGFIDPVQTWPTDAASPSGIAIVNDTILVANLRGRVLRAVPVADPTSSTELYAGEYGRLRDVTLGPDGTLFVLTNNTDGRGSPREGDDRIVSLAVPRA
ncbi:Glucose/arabinose dehydrogenase, beta-propeller fold [Microbacterium sp. LKL04]|uniref:PQQ-dependent sugar dehydrogenase n=1 Tax=Microbacterium sp. LKL04 TaxID=912630 RepID=UPI000875DDE9|nr:PQQ-dependent sugar dehydrogenase [Microbacterium sp. LKL04]SCY57183.1 Glucose/arabinose dehydrogenase, beta-propeller fold [Microbacterium sp. LKL04]